MLSELVDLGLGQHPPITHQDHADQAKALSQLLDLIGHRGGIAVVAGSVSTP
jgi:hypothetical protein